MKPPRKTGAELSLVPWYRVSLFALMCERDVQWQNVSICCCFFQGNLSRTVPKMGVSVDFSPAGLRRHGGKETALGEFAQHSCIIHDSYSLDQVAVPIVFQPCLDNHLFKKKTKVYSLGIVHTGARTPLHRYHSPLTLHINISYTNL